MAVTTRLGYLLLVLLAGWAHAETLVISKPPRPVLASDPPQGRMVRLSERLDAYSVAWDATLPLSYVALDALGTAYFTYGGPDEGGILNVPGWPEGSGASHSISHSISGPATGLQDPKDLALIETPDGLWIAVADFGATRVAVFDASATGDAPPLFVLDVLPPDGGSVWGVLYHAEAGRLFISTTDGYVLVFEDFPARRGANGPERVILPTLDGKKASANLHGMSYHAASDTLVVTDVGPTTTAAQSADFATNGALFVLENASRADGPTAVRARLAGPNTLLGNPVDVVLSADGAALVAEKAGDLVLRFAGVLALEGVQDVAPDGAISVVAPEGLFLP